MSEILDHVTFLLRDENKHAFPRITKAIYAVNDIGKLCRVDGVLAGHPCSHSGNLFCGHNEINAQGFTTAALTSGLFPGNTQRILASPCGTQSPTNLTFVLRNDTHPEHVSPGNSNSTTCCYEFELRMTLHPRSDAFDGEAFCCVLYAGECQHVGSEVLNLQFLCRHL